jgi:hypothetical protein
VKIIDEGYGRRKRSGIGIGIVGVRVVVGLPSKKGVCGTGDASGMEHGLRVTNKERRDEEGESFTDQSAE